MQRPTRVQGAKYKNMQNAQSKNGTSISRPFLPSSRQHYISGEKDYELEMMDEDTEMLHSGHNRETANMN